ncbi:FAD/FMN-dependent dehydrogenase [Desulfosporosinus orientis DSM 765]|uniref:FAD/FMN-dependent dehydrogenase n=1 Tax=Desulfosporosinus orientis (strain ATCC 19365 / DSM 765 / NCIMB 8382 / VKM B-1628 / Singapore I) TaxID=768706 RepID=G7WIY6_DESOD|nr:FAD-binding oxidoreductase [Desulfosporosinus orientis]AET69711.1 FAD/FMN-dependent dehydrogenase [Desulfosporosinus orientis DSM 765]
MTQQQVVDVFKQFIPAQDTYSHYRNLFEAGYRPDLIFYPESAEDVAGILKLANQCQLPVYPVGSGTIFQKRIEPFAAGILMSTKKLKRIIEYRPKNMSIEVEAGLTFQELQKLLARDKIFFPVEPDEISSTIGGQVAANRYGRKKYMYKSSRFYVMGMEFVSPQGDIIRVGGRTVKNVSGYDVSQLLAGSWGLFGIITKVTLRLRPLPENNLIMKCSFRGLASVQAIIKGIFNEPLSLASLLLRTDGEELSLQLELEGFKEALELQASEMERKYGFKRSSNLLEKIKEMPFTFRVPLQNYGRVLECLWAWAEKHRLSVNIQGNVTNGTLEIDLKNTVDDEGKLIEELSGELRQFEGCLIHRGNTLRAKAEMTNQKLLLEIKRQVDPNKILVPQICFLKE